MKKKYLAAKININENIYGDNVTEMIQMIPDAIKAAKHLQVKQWTWSFSDIGEIDDGLLHGKLSKARKEIKETLDLKTKTTQHTVIPNSSESSFFIYDPVNEILIFEETSKLNRETFIEIFQRLVYLGNINIGNIVIKLVPRKDELYSKIKGIEVLTKIEFDLIPLT
ncbi:hypothetical protein CIG75_12675 [Tumebacillus algifaecis]|uniref:Uncharacterized protein n=1 Tax=Tumebacillus algifaecis TaxID=1214604 RepID=A0A223D2W5_9BACL|nr:hypothetical protein [Tumebacillus algifaecis]ASS75753.1 hypothetical protein CIG75_12675 [Tumebacillus algifaecis]